MVAFYSQQDQDIYEKNKFMPQSKYLLNAPTFNTPTVEEEKITETFGIPNTNAFTNSGGGGGGGNYSGGNFQQVVDDRQDRLNDIDTSTFMGKAKDFMNPQSAKQIMDDGYQEPRFQPGIIGTIMGKFDNYRNLPQADQAFISQNMGYTGPTIFGENNSGLSKDEFGINTRSMFGNYAEYVDKMNKDSKDMTDKEFEDYVNTFKGLQKRKKISYRQKKIERDNLQEQEKLAKEERDIGIKTLNQRMRDEGVTGSDYDQAANIAGGGGGNTTYKGQTAREATYDDDKNTGTAQSYSQHYAKGGRAGYFFGGRAGFAEGGWSPGVGRDEKGYQSDHGSYTGGDNFVPTVNPNEVIEEKIKEKLMSNVPERINEDQVMMEKMKKYQTLNRNIPRPFFMNRSNEPDTVNKDLYTSNLTDLNLQYPNIEIKDEYGMINKDKAKSLIDKAILEQTISPVDGLNLTRSIDTTGTQSNTSGNYTLGNFNFNSPNIEEGVLNSNAKFNLGDSLQLGANVGSNDSTINNAKLGFNYDGGTLTGSTYRNKDYGYTTNELGVDKQFDIGNNFKVGLDGNYSNTIFDGENDRNSDLTPSLSYDDGTFNANLSKEIVEGGTQPNLGIGFQKNGFYGSADNLLSNDPTGVLGYQKTIGGSDSPLQFSAGGEWDPFTGNKTAGVYGKYTFANGGLASIL